MFIFVNKICRVPAGNPAGGQFSRCGSGGAVKGEDGIWRNSLGEVYSKAHQEILSRIQIPKGWTDIAVNANPAGSPVVKGIDSKGRIVSVTHPDVSAEGEAYKWVRNDSFSSGPVSKLAREAYSGAAKGDGTAAAIYLTLKSGMRPGSMEDTKASQQAYGVSTITGKNVMLVGKDKVRFQFTGKKGVEQGHTITSPVLAKFIRSRNPGNEELVFGTDGNKMLAAVKKIAGSEYKVRDIRTWRATTDARRLIKTFPKPEGPKAIQKAKMAIAAKVSKTLGNRPAQALESYINPGVWAMWEF